MAEAQLVRNIVKAIRQNYPHAWIHKVVGNPYQQTGVPDVLVLVNGRLVGLEAKYQRAGESAQHARDRATPGQLKQIEAIKRAGGHGAVVLSVDDALATIRHTMEWETQQHG